MHENNTRSQYGGCHQTVSVGGPDGGLGDDPHPHGWNTRGAGWLQCIGAKINFGEII